MASAAILVFAGCGNGAPRGVSSSQSSSTGGRESLPSSSSAVPARPVAPTAQVWSNLPDFGLAARVDPTVVWSGREVLLWGGLNFMDRWEPFGDGVAFDPTTGVARPLPPSPLSPRVGHSAVWTGAEMLVWGGSDHPECDSSVSDGAAFNPATQQWRPLEDSPLRPRIGHAALWTGTEMIVWGGRATSTAVEVAGGCSLSRPEAGLVDGAAYNPSTRQWRVMAEPPLASRAYGFSAVWTGSEMIVWGGVDGPWPPIEAAGDVRERERRRADGMAYNPISDSWRIIGAGPLAGRAFHSAVWTGSEVIIWGGDELPNGTARGGAAYNPMTDSWRPIAAGPLLPRYGQTAVWTGTLMAVWAGCCDSGPSEADGALYDPVSDTWYEMPPSGLAARWRHVAVATNDAVLVWGGNHEEHPGDGVSNELLADGAVLTITTRTAA